MATRTINIRGVILDASYDAGWLESYIAKGLFTPESRVRAELAAAKNAHEDVEVVVSSEGGSVFAGFEMSNAIRDFAREGKLHLTVGAFAASAAAMIVLDAANAGIPVSAHSNSILLFHGAWSLTVGGRDAHEDSARLLDQINSVIKEGLKLRGVPDDKIDAGFGEGRQLTMTAAESQGYGIVSEVVNQVADKPAKPTADDTAVIRENGIQFDMAAWDDSSDGEPAPVAEPAPAVADAATTPAGDCEPTEPAPADLDPAGRGQLMARIDSLTSQMHALQSAKDREIARVNQDALAAIAEAQSERDSALAELESYRATAQNEISTLRDRLASIEGELAAAKAAHAALVGTVNAPAHDRDVPSDWRDAVARFGLQDAIRLYPELAREYREHKAAK